MFINRYTKIVLTTALALAGQQSFAGGTFSKAGTASSSKATVAEPTAEVATEQTAGPLELALIEACCKGNFEEAKRLLAIPEINVKAQNSFGETPLIHAALKNNLEMVQLLVDKGADVNVEAFGRTPLIWAADHNNLEMVRVLMAHGADVNAQSKHRNTTPLILAVFNNNLEMVQLLLAHSANTNAQDNGGSTPLILAAKRNPAIARLLIANGADVNAKDIEGKTPLYWTTEAHNLEMVKLLLALGANVNTQDNDGKTPLILSASYYCNLATVKLLVDKGAAINARDRFGNTPLILAARRKDRAMVQLLVDKSSDVNADLDTAKKYHLVDIVDYLTTAIVAQPTLRTLLCFDTIFPEEEREKTLIDPNHRIFPPELIDRMLKPMLAATPI